MASFIKKVIKNKLKEELFGKEEEEEEKKPQKGEKKNKLSPSELFARFKKKKSEAELDGVIRVSVLRAQGLRNADGFFAGVSDPFVSVLIADEKGETPKANTTTKNNDLNPIWKEFFEFPVQGKFQHVIFRVFDSDMGGKSEFLGQVKVSARDLWEHRLINGQGQTLLPEDNAQPTEPVPTGTLDFKVEYRPASLDGRVSIKIEKGEGIKHDDTRGKGDPFCCVLFDSDEVVRTKTIKDTYDPVWNETFEVDVAGEYSSIYLSVWDDDALRDDYVCHLTLPAKDLRQKGSISGTFPLYALEDDDEQPSPTTPSLGTLTFTLQWSPPVLAGKLDVKVTRANDLLSKSSKLLGWLWEGKNSPFVEVFLAEADGSQPLSLGKTAVVKNNNNPEWTYTLHYEFTDGKPHSSLLFVVWDGKSSGPQDAVGCVELSTQELARFKSLKGDFTLAPYRGSVAGGTLTLEVLYSPDH